jgi:gamma-glutamyltranspeptidase/glutathione hydrolase
MIWASHVERLKDQPGFAKSFLPRGRAPRAGEHFRPRDQAATLTEIAKTEGESFYRGAIAATIARAAKAGGGMISEGDLAHHTADFVQPIDVAFQGHRVH